MWAVREVIRSNPPSQVRRRTTTSRYVESRGIDTSGCALLALLGLSP